MTQTAPARTTNSPRAQVVRTIRQWMDEGVLVQGQALPSERELAARLGVTRTTVRRALKVMQENGLLNSHTERTRTLAPVHEQGGLLRDSIAVLTGEPGVLWTDDTATGWSGYIAYNAMQAIRDTGLHVVGLHPERMAGRGIAQLIAEKPRGVIIPHLHLDLSEELRWAHALRASGIPVVVLGDSPELAGFDRISSSHESGAYQLTRWLIGAGHRRILRVSNSMDERPWYSGLRAGYKRAMHEAGIRPMTEIRVPSSEEPDVVASWRANAVAWSEVLRPHLTGRNPVHALMLNSDGHVFPAAMACRLLGLEPNRDVALVGYDNYWASARRPLVEPAVPLATVDKRNAQLGSMMVRLLLDRAEGRLEEGPVLREIEPELVITGSPLGPPEIDLEEKCS